MAVSGTVAFNPSGGDLTLFAFAMCGIRRTELTQQHMEDARMALNLMFQEWGNETPNLWTVSLVEETLVEGQAEYDVDPDTIMILDAYIRTNDGEESQNDRIIWPISRTEYAAMPNKTLEAPPTVFWFDRLLSPTITLWQTPDSQGPYLLRYYRCTQIQDIALGNGQSIDTPVWFLPATAYGLAARLAVIYAPDRAQALDAKAESVLKGAREQNTENVPLMLMPMIGSYYPSRR